VSNFNSVASHRIEYIDSLKGIGILLVLLGHVSGIPATLHDVIYSFHMPLFFIISGFLFSGKAPAYDYVKKKTLRLIIPAWFMGLLCGGPFIILLLLGKIDSTEFLSRLLGTMGGYPVADNNFHCSPIWFLFAIFWVDVLAMLLFKLLGEHWLFVLFFVGVISGVIGQMFDGYFIFNLNIACTSIQYFIVGIILRRFNILSNDRLIAFGLFVFIACYLSSPETINLSRNYIGGKWFAVTFLGAVGASLFCVYISKNLNNELVKWIGRNTIYIIGFDYYINSLADVVVELLFNEGWYINFFVKLIFALLFVATLSRIYIVNEIVSGRINLIDFKKVIRIRYT
jgi:acyltransferase